MMVNSITPWVVRPRDPAVTLDLDLAGIFKTSVVVALNPPCRITDDQLHEQGFLVVSATEHDAQRIRRLGTATVVQDQHFRT